MSRTADQLRRVGPKIVRELSQAIFAAGEHIITTAQINITTGSQSGKNHTSSSPGSAPNNDTGVLANGIEVNRLANNPLGVRVSSAATGADKDGGDFGPGRSEVSSNAPYAIILEFGSSRMAARPYFQPAIDESRPAVNRILAKAKARALRTAGR